jgi:transcriptional regulator NrdR family protein
MICPCGGFTIVKDGRLISEGYWRRRHCTTCGAESTTLEQVCETVKGTRLRERKIVKPAPLKVVRPKRPRTVKAPIVTAPVPRETVKSSQSRMEDMRMEKEYG